MTWHVRVIADRANGGPLDIVRVDRAGGRLANYGPSMSFDPYDGPGIEVLVCVEADGPAQGLQEGLEVVMNAFQSVGEPLTFRAGTVYTVEEFDRWSESLTDVSAG